MLTNKQKKLNNFILRESGLELDDNGHVIDQDTGMPIIVKDKNVKYNNTAICRLANNEIEFDPLNNPLLAQEICTNFINKVDAEGDISVTAFGLSNKERNTPGRAICIAEDKIISKEYILDSLKYIDLIATINHTDTDSKDTIILKSYDQKEVKTSRRR